MSATSGVEATTRRTAAAGSAESATRRNAISMHREAMAVTPEEGGPLEREPLVVLSVLRVLVDLIELEAQALELGREPGREDGAGDLTVARTGDVHGVVAADAEGVAAAEEGLEIGVALVAVEALVGEDRIARDRVGADLEAVELLVVPVPLRAEHEALVELARPRLVAQRRVEAVEVALVLMLDGEKGAAELEV